MLRDERLARLNELLEVCEEAVAAYRDEADEATEVELSRILKRYAADRELSVMALSGAIRRLGDLPDVPDADRAAAMRWAERTRARLSDHHDRVLAERAVARERHIAALARAAVEEARSPELASLLAATAESAEAAEARLAPFAGGAGGTQ